jgi:iron complex outermembrane receptor protein
VGPFTQLSWTPSERLFIAAGGRYDRSTFAVADHLLTDGDASGSRTLASTSGNVGLSYGFNGLFTPYTNVSTAFDTPTTTELANQPNSTGGFNTLLNPQKTLSVEVGARGHVARTLEYTVAVFRSSVRDAIIQYQEVGGRAYYTNAGRTRNDGVELGLSVAPTRGLRLFGSYTYGNYVFRDYTVVTGATSVSYAGKRLAGTPHSFARFGLRSQPVQGLTVDIDHTLSSSLFADDANTQVVNGWGNGVTNARASWTGRYQALSFAPFIGVNNLWNRAYVGSVTVNGTFGRVLEPAPLRNIYIGAEIGYRVIRR